MTARQITNPPTATTTSGSRYTTKLNPLALGSSRIHSPYLAMKYCFTSSGDFPEANWSRTTPFLSCASSEGES